MKFILNNKGFSFSPYLMIVMMFLGIIMAFHYIVVDSEKAIAISDEGGTLKNALQVEGLKSSVRNAILLSAYDYIDRGINSPTLQKPTLNVKDNGLQKYLEEYIAYDLDNMRPGFGAWAVSINQKDDKGKIRSDGFLVSAESGSDKVEKFVDSGVFAYYDKYKTYKEDFLKEFSKSLTCRLGSISCTTNTNWLTKQKSLYCKSSTDDDGDVIYSYSSIPGDHYLDADEVVKRIKEALIDLANKEAKGLALSDYKKSGAPIVFNVDYIDATVAMNSFDVDGECCDFVHNDNGNKCNKDKYEELQQVSLTVSGKIHFKEMYMLGDGAIKQKDDGFEVCVKSPIMTKDGTVKPLKFSEGEFDLPYAISLSYRTPCEPDQVKKSNSIIGPLQENEYIPGFELNQESLKFTLKPVDCKWDVDGSYAPECASGRKLTRIEWQRCSSCHNACYYEENVPNSYSSWHYFCPPDDSGPPND